MTRKSSSAKPTKRMKRPRFHIIDNAPGAEWRKVNLKKLRSKMESRRRSWIGRKLSRRSLYAVPLTLLTTGVASILALAAVVFAPKSQAYNRVESWWTHTIHRIAGARIEANGLDHVDPSRTYIILANHASHLDIPALMESTPVPIRFFTRENLFKIPFFGLALKLTGHIPIDRRKGATDFDKLRTECEKLVARGHSILVFPEGTRSMTPEMLPFKKGAFHVAQQLGFPILPVSIHGSHDCHPARTFIFRRGTIRLTFHDPIDPDAYDIDTLAAHTRTVIASGLGEQVVRSKLRRVVNA